MVELLKQYGFWTFTHALFDPLPRSAFWLSFWTICPVLFWMMAFARDIPLRWWIVTGLFTLQILIVPGLHYMIGMLPFLCVIAIQGIRPILQRRWALWTILALSLYTAGRMGIAVIRPWGFFGMRRYGVMDIYDMAAKLKGAGYERPLWVNVPAVYFVLNEPIPNDSFLTQLTNSSLINWNTGKFKPIRTMAYFLKKSNPLPDVPEWSIERIKLARGQYTELLIVRRK